MTSRFRSQVFPISFSPINFFSQYILIWNITLILRDRVGSGKQWSYAPNFQNDFGLGGSILPPALLRVLGRSLRQTERDCVGRDDRHGWSSWFRVWRPTSQQLYSQEEEVFSQRSPSVWLSGKIELKERAILPNWSCSISIYFPSLQSLLRAKRGPTHLFFFSFFTIFCFIYEKLMCVVRVYLHVVAIVAFGNLGY